MSNLYVCDCDQKHRKVYFYDTRFVYMDNDRFDLKTFVDVLWKDRLFVNDVHNALKVVSKRRSSNQISMSMCSFGIVYFIRLPDLEKMLEKIFKEAKLPKFHIQAAVESNDWKLLRVLLDESKLLWKHDYIKILINKAGEYLEKVDVVEFGRSNPDYKYAANAIGHLNKSNKKRKTSDDDDNED